MEFYAEDRRFHFLAKHATAVKISLESFEFLVAVLALFAREHS
jgi:hypothetical protein